MPFPTSFPTGLDNYIDGVDVIHADAINALEKTAVGPALFNVKGYGAKGDGSTDDTVAIQSTIIAAGTTGTLIYPPGTYSVTSTIVPPSAGGQTWLAWGATLIWNGGTNTSVIRNTAVVGTHLQDFHLEGMTIDCHNATGVTGLFLDSWFLGSMTDIWVKNATSTGTAAVRLEATSGTTSANSNAYNNIRGLRISSAAVGLRMSGVDGTGAVPVTNNYFYGLMMDDIIEKGISIVQSCDTNTWHGTRIAGRGGTGTWIGITYNDSATPNASVNVYNQHFITLALDNPTGLPGQDALRFNYTAGNRVQGLWTSIGPGGTPGNLINDTNGGTNAQSYTVELMSASGAFASTKSTVYTKGYTQQISRQVVAFVTPYTPDPTAGEIIEFGVLTGSITMNAPTVATRFTGNKTTFRFTQNGVGGWVVAWDAVYKTSWQPNPQPNAISEITFYDDGTNLQQYAVTLIDNLGRTNTPAELIVGGFLNGASSINAGTTLTSVNQTYPGAEAGGKQTTGGLLHATTVPTNANGNNNDWVIADNGHQYFRRSAAWTDTTAHLTAQSSPSNPTGTTSTTGVMMGLAGTITPRLTGNILILCSGDIFNVTAIADGGKVQIRHGTGTAPVNAAALTGTADGGLVQFITATTAEKSPFALQAVVTGLALGTAVWLDVGLAAITGGTATIENVSLTAVEI